MSEEKEKLLSLICDEVCKYPYQCADEEELHERCDSCRLVKELIGEESVK